MKLIRRVGSSPAIDPCMGDPVAQSFCAALARRDWPTARQILLDTDHPDDRCFLLDACGSVPDVQDWIGPLTADPLAQLVRGCHAVAWAWDARGRRQARYTGADKFQLFFERLRLAESSLYDVVAANPDEVAAWAFLVRTARGLQLGLEDGEFRFQQAISRHATNLKAHAEWLQTCCQKWGGTHDRMFHLAHSAAAAAPDGNMLHALIPLAHLELMIDLDVNEALHHMNRPDVRSELRAAADRSVLHPAADLRPGWPLYYNTFALAFTKAADHPAAAAVFSRLGDHVTEHPWQYVALSPARAFRKARATHLKQN
ncbi:hypothetical protein HPO96_18000 [Kribbella sandramycini]|uniref:DUF4034 domain-containing protein n=1 Tax=Kribbella sandramycini TaxID=60450 RepID=A0A7Y4L0N8_9ACTN|nr:hypothetical protein [Kribbella sandramycini]MBB6565878.1 hypothetical protein [Kribbella sandramycini]NOL42142.1 hypothetical protein [Kribbella sandramycini]